MSKFRLGVSIILSAVALELTGCSKADEATEDFVGIILPDAGIPIGDSASSRWETADRKFLQAEFDAVGVRVDIQNANGDKAAFATIADQMLAAGAKVLIMVNIDSDSAKAVQEKAATQGVKTIDYARLTLNGLASYYVAFDDEAVGRIQGEGIKACLDAVGKKEARIVYLNGESSDHDAILLRAGYDSVLRPLIDSKRYTLVDDQDVPDRDTVRAGAIFEQQLSKAGGKLDAVVAASEGLELAAIEVLKKNKLNGKVCVSGNTSSVDGLRAILRGDLSITVYKAIKEEAKAAAALAIALLKGAVPTNLTGSVYNGAVYVPSVLLAPMTIMKANVKDVIAAGFQTREDVCVGIGYLCTANGI